MSLVGSGVLLWLIKSMPNHSLSSHAESEMSENKGEDEHLIETEGHEESASMHEDSDIEHVDHNAEKKPEEHSEEQNLISELKLVLRTDPAEADIYVDDEYYGKSPVEIPLNEISKNLRVEKESFQVINEKVPPISAAKNGNIHWNITLVESKEKTKTKTKTKIIIPLIKGKQGPAFIQIKALPIKEFNSGNYGLNKESIEGLVGCKVNISGKGLWVRILRGPYLKSFAHEQLNESKMKYSSDAFLTGEQKCLN